MYTVPISKQEQFFDFYMLEKLLSHNGLISRSIDKAIKAGISPTYVSNISNSVDDWSLEDEVDYKLLEVADKLIPYLREMFLEALYFSIASEMRHSARDNDYIIYSYNYGRYNYDYAIWRDLQNDINFRIPFLDNLKDYKTEYLDSSLYNSDVPRDRYVSYMLSLKNYSSKIDFIKDAKVIFEEDEIWEDGYGGESWSIICDAWLRLYRAIPNRKNRYQDIIIAIDHIFDLEHNNGNVFEKLVDYDTENWMKSAFIYRKLTSNPWQLYKYISKGMKKIAAMAIKEKFGITHEGNLNNLKNIIDNFEETFDNINKIACRSVDFEEVVPLMSLKYDVINYIDLEKLNYSLEGTISYHELELIVKNKNDIDFCVNAYNQTKNKKLLVILWDCFWENFASDIQIESTIDLNKVKFLADYINPNLFPLLQLRFL